MQVHISSSPGLAVPLEWKQLEEGGCCEEFQHISVWDFQIIAAAGV